MKILAKSLILGRISCLSKTRYHTTSREGGSSSPPDPPGWCQCRSSPQRAACWRAAGRYPAAASCCGCPARGRPLFAPPAPQAQVLQAQSPAHRARSLKGKFGKRALFGISHGSGTSECEQRLFLRHRSGDVAAPLCLAEHARCISSYSALL